MRGGRLVHFGVLALIALACVGARWDYTADDTLAALGDYGPRIRCVVGYETGWSWSPNLVGRAGELGPVQLHPYGKLPEFYDQGYSDPWDPYQAIHFMASEIARGNGDAWSPILLGYC